MLSGPHGLRLITGFHDEAVTGEGKGYRSSHLGAQYRIICRTVPEGQMFQVVSIAAHDYRRLQ
jgi:proteic killer suppression protein